jgi:hypothetical protein
VLDYILFTQRGSGGNSQQGLAAPFPAPCSICPPAASPRLGRGVRKERGWLYPDPLVVNGSANIVRQDPIEGEYSAKEAFVEFAVPLLQDIPLVGYATLTWPAAIRTTTCSAATPTTRWGWIGRYGRTSQIRLNYATAFSHPQHSGVVRWHRPRQLDYAGSVQQLEHVTGRLGHSGQLPSRRACRPTFVSWATPSSPRPAAIPTSSLKMRGPSRQALCGPQGLRRG